ncbi:hypothetical protein PIROE2DRAFT_63795 [Piromyces sp. E2]|nr:hypothetical protein PIROE2DRAFT_63795 [Piromyces sp. E2]|eukprot:OUM59428.1 hypothetical protein PIROE2DRAFT_63795 [Piromyces sp. E2]
MYRQALKNKDTLSHNEKLYNTIFRERDYYNDYSREKLNYEAAEKLLRSSTSDSIINDEKAMELYESMNMNSMDNIPTNPPPTVEKITEVNERESSEIIENQDIDINNEDNFEDKLEIADDINSNMVEKNSSYKSFSFSDSLKPSDGNKSNNSIFPSPNNTSRRSSELVPLCMDDVINSGSVKLPVIEPQRRKNWHALSISEVYEQRPSWNPYNDEPKNKLIIPGIERKYQRFIPSKNGNNFWRVCDGNIYDNLY